MPSRGSSSRPRSDSHQRSQQQQQYHQNSQPTSSSGKSNNNNGMYLIPVNGTGSSNNSGINHDQSNHHLHYHGSSSSQGRRSSTGDHHHHHQVQQQQVQQQQGIYQGGLSYPPNSRSNSNSRGGSASGGGTTPRNHHTPSAFSVGQNSTTVNHHPSVDSSNSLALRVLDNDGNSSPSSRHRGGGASAAGSHGHGTPSSQPSLSIIPHPHVSTGPNTREKRPNSRDEGHPQPEEEEEDYYSSDELSSDLDEKEEEGEVDGGEEVCSFNTMLTAFACGLPFALSLIATGCITFLVENDPAKAILALSLQLILLCSGCGIYLKLRKFEKDSTDRQKERDKRRKQLNSRRKEIESKRKERERQTVANRAATTKGSISTIGASTSATNSLTITMTNPAPAQPQYFHRGFVRDFMDKSRKRERDLRGQWDMAVLQHRVDVRNVSFGGGGGTRESTNTSTSTAALLGGTETGREMMTASSESLATRLLQGASGSYDALQDFIPFDERVCPFASASAVLFRHVTESSLTITSSAARPCLVVGATEFTMRLDPNQKFLGYPLTGKQVVNVSNCHSALKKSEFANRYLLPFSVFSGFDQQWLLLAQPASVNLCSLSEIVSGAAARQGKKSSKPGLHWALSVLRQIILVVCRSLHLHGIAHRKLSLKSILVPADTFNPSGLTLGDIDSLALYPLEDLEIVCEEAAAGMSSGGPTSSGGAAGSFGPTAGGTFSSLQGGAYGSSSMPTLRGHPMLYSAGILRDVCAIGSIASDLVKPYLERDTSVPGPMKEIVSQHLDSFLNLVKKFKKKRKCRAELFLLHPLLEIQAQLKPKTS